MSTKSNDDLFFYLLGTIYIYILHNLGFAIKATKSETNSPCTFSTGFPIRFSKSSANPAVYTLW